MVRKYTQLMYFASTPPLENKLPGNASHKYDIGHFLL